MNYEKKYNVIIKHYESCLEKHGDSHLGMDWPSIEDANTRHSLMLGIMPIGSEKSIELLDFGCGASHFWEYIQNKGIKNIDYSGLDISEKFIALSRSKYPFNTYYCLDILDEGVDIPDFDYIIMNGVFTSKRELSFDYMLSYFKKVIHRVFQKARIGLAFNVFSKHVDWEKDDLFHLPFDLLAEFLKKEISRYFVIRCDHKLYDYTVYVYKQEQI